MLLACNNDQISTYELYSWSPLVEILLKVYLLTRLLIASQFKLSYTANAKFLATLVLYRDLN